MNAESGQVYEQSGVIRGQTIERFVSVEEKLKYIIIIYYNIIL